MTLRARILAIAALLIVTQAASGQDKTYTVRPGDTLFSIARSYGISVDELRQMNDLEEGVIRAGLVLLVSAAPQEQPVGSFTLDSLSDRLGLSPQALLALNPDIGRLIDSLNRTGRVSEEKTDLYSVKPGDTLFGIARTHGLTISRLKSLNDLANSGIRPGQILKISVDRPQVASIWQSRGEMLWLLYPGTYSGRTMASGLQYDPDARLIGHPSLPMGTLVMLVGRDKARRVLCIVADVSLSLDPGILDLSESVLSGLGTDRHVNVFTLR